MLFVQYFPQFLADVRQTPCPFTTRKTTGQVEPPKKTPERPVKVLDEDTKSVVRRKVHSFYFKKQIPTVDKILIKLGQDDTLRLRRRARKLARVLKTLISTYTLIYYYGPLLKIWILSGKTITVNHFNWKAMKLFAGDENT
ncbi:hypothetical protein NQ317_004077 [Molorchus minor]|uniref:Uncharacterized protein n=1 Tax=Molorchus minor TaxID=1323400 RepID=A0ABQ9JAU2_9CUCU|nr:hypothetical protein NQ317_004077 [Molorchus minor]